MTFRLRLLFAAIQVGIASGSAQTAAAPLPVAVFNFEAGGDAPAKLGPDLANLLAADLRCLPPITAVPRAKLGAEPTPVGSSAPNLEESIAPAAAVQLGQQYGATALVTGRVLVTRLQAQLIAKITDTSSGRIYGEMVQGPLTPTCSDLASELGVKIATLLTGLRGLPVSSWAPATFHRVLGGDSVWAQPPTATIQIDGQLAAPAGDLTLIPGLHEMTVSYAYDGGSVRAAFQLAAKAGGRYRVMFQAIGPERLKLWVARADTLAPVTTSIGRVWLPGPDSPLRTTAQFPLPEVRFDSAVVGDDQALYLVGGKKWHGGRASEGPWGNTPDLVGQIERFDLKTHQFTTLSGSIGPRQFQAAALVDGKIYILGPEDSLSSRSHSLAIYDLASGQLSYGPAMPRPVNGFGTAVVDRRLYVVGGWAHDPKLVHSNLHPSISSVDYFDLRTQSWNSAAPLLLSAEGKAVPLAGGIVFAGGLMGEGTTNQDQRNIFVIKMRLPRLSWNARSGGGGVSANRDDKDMDSGDARLDHDTDLPYVQFLNPETGAWTFLAPLPAAIPVRTSAVLENRLFIFDDRDDSVQYYDPTTGEGSIFHLKTSLPGSSAVAIGDQLFVVGGSAIRDGFITAYRMNPNWSRFAAAARPLE